MTATPETIRTPSEDTQHHFLIGVAEQGNYALGFAKAGRVTEALEHADAIERLLVAYRLAVGAPAPDGQGALHRAHVSLAAQAGSDQAKLAKLRSMHRPRTERPESCCVQCGIVWPCPTSGVLGDGDQ